MRRHHPRSGTLLVEGRPVAPVEFATTRRARRRGLLGRTRVDGAFWLEPCRQVHSFRMRFTIDVAYLDRRGRVLLVRTLPPGRLAPLSWRTHTIIETAEGALQDWGIHPGTTVTVAPHEETR